MKKAKDIYNRKIWGGLFLFLGILLNICFTNALTMTAVPVDHLFQVIVAFNGTNYGMRYAKMDSASTLIFQKQPSTSILSSVSAVLKPLICSADATYTRMQFTLGEANLKGMYYPATNSYIFGGQVSVNQHNILDGKPVGDPLDNIGIVKLNVDKDNNVSGTVTFDGFWFQSKAILTIKGRMSSSTTSVDSVASNPILVVDKNGKIVSASPTPLPTSTPTLK